MAKVTYLLGAGASAGSYPVVDDMDEKIGLIAGHLNSIVSFEKLRDEKNNELIEG